LFIEEMERKGKTGKEINHSLSQALGRKKERFKLSTYIHLAPVTSSLAKCRLVADRVKERPGDDAEVKRCTYGIIKWVNRSTYG
jgi:hypothetical protein